MFGKCLRPALLRDALCLELSTLRSAARLGRSSLRVRTHTTSISTLHIRGGGPSSNHSRFNSFSCRQTSCQPVCSICSTRRCAFPQGSGFMTSVAWETMGPNSGRGSDHEMAFGVVFVGAMSAFSSDTQFHVSLRFLSRPLCPDSSRKNELTLQHGRQGFWTLLLEQMFRGDGPCACHSKIVENTALLAWHQPIPLKLETSVSKLVLAQIICYRCFFEHLSRVH